MKTTYLMSKAISTASIGEKNFHLSHVLFELLDFELQSLKMARQEKAKR